jgi:pantoate--beta-alanine ligase
LIKVLPTAASLRRLSDVWRKKGKTVGFVPTMGALHAGHAALIRRAAKECDFVVVSIFVNPKQFGPNEDFSRYPRTFAADKKLCAAAGAAAIYHPSVEAMYPDGFSTKVSVSGVTEPLEGAKRPGHFDGVATVVAKLLIAGRPDKAYFGEKDFQQLAVVRRLAKDLDLGVGIVGCKIVREKDGLALSSRNVYLSPAERKAAPLIRKALGLKAVSAVRAALKKIPGAKVDYAELVDPETFEKPARRTRKLRLLTAVRLGKTRLIDNVDVSC